MPLVRFYETVPAKSGTIPAKGTISFVPTSPYFKTSSEHVLPAVSYTHLTLPTILLV